MKTLLLAHIKAELKRRNITNKDIADRLGKTPVTISSWLKDGKVTLKKLDEILVAYGIKIDKIIFK